MRRSIWVAGIAVAALFPSFAFAQESCRQQEERRVAGTVIGGVVGALAGNAISKGGGKTGGTIIGGVAGAVIGNQIAKGGADCSNAYGYYDRTGAWHASNTPASQAAGYYDRDDRWVQGAPQGYYGQDGRWVQAGMDSSSSGYRDSHGRWVPASADGYYGQDGQWNGGAASGYYDTSGRWNAGPARGAYDASGRWISGQASGYRNNEGVWVSNAQTGYYDTDGRWRSGAARGYYDARGRWVGNTLPVAMVRDTRPDRMDRDDRRMDLWTGAGAGTRQREAFLDSRIRSSISRGALDRAAGNRALTMLAAIRKEDTSMRRRTGRLTPKNQTYILGRLDRLAISVNQDLRQERREDRREGTPSY